MRDIVNDTLALAQFITNGRSEEFSVTYLLALERLSIDDWRAAKRELAIDDSTNHRTKEQFIKLIVSHFKNEDVDVAYCLRDLSLAPGFSNEAIELVSYNTATIHCIKSISSAIQSNTSKQGRLANEASRTTSHAATHNIAPGNTTAPLPYIESEYPPLHIGAGAPPSSKQKPKKPPLDKPSTPGNAKKGIKTWIIGSSASTNNNISQQLKFVCLGVRSGAEETIQSLTEVLNKWNCVRDLKVEAVRKSHHSTTFRVQYNIPISLHTKWQKPDSWPTRCWVSEWRGNPKIPLKPLEERIHKMKIYIGSLPQNAKPEKITANMERFYRQEIENGTIQKIESFINQPGLERARKRHCQDPSQVITSSACVVLSSSPGKDLSEVGLKLDQYSHEIRRTVRRWMGPIPLSRTDPVIPQVW